jgi:CubicO group peptidase (beta-lactamase class C family)
VRRSIYNAFGVAHGGGARQSAIVLHDGRAFLECLGVLLAFLHRLGPAVAFALLLAVAETASAQWVQRGGDGPRFRPDGPNAALFGRDEGYPACTGLAYIAAPRCRVGAFSAFERLFPSRPVAAPAAPSPLGRAAEPALRYNFDGAERTLDDYLDRHPVTGLLIARGDTILVERYQYGRTDAHRMATFSMAKTVTGLLVGLAVADGAIRSIDDTAETYVPGLKGTEYGRTPIRALLQMSSGISFREDYGDPASDIYRLARLTLEGDPGGSVAALRLFDRRAAAPGAVFSYSSADSLALGLVLRGATGRPVADYASEKLWRPLGAEATAHWSVDATGQEITFAYFHAVLRDWARLGLMLAHGGRWAGRQVVPAEWVKAATTAQQWPERPYGYQIWVSPFDPARYYLSGLRHQFVLVDPALKLVLVQTSLGGGERAIDEMSALWNAARAQAR